MKTWRDMPARVGSRYGYFHSYSQASNTMNVHLVQWMTQSTVGLTKSTHGGTVTVRDEFSYPLSVFSNYTLYPLEFGTSLYIIRIRITTVDVSKLTTSIIGAAYSSAINNTFDRSLQPPPLYAGGVPYSIHSSEKARGDVGLDNAPGLRHAVNGSGETTQEFAYSDARRQVRLLVHIIAAGLVYLTKKSVLLQEGPCKK